MVGQLGGKEKVLGIEEGIEAGEGNGVGGAKVLLHFEVDKEGEGLLGSNCFEGGVVGFLAGDIIVAGDLHGFKL